MDQNTLSVQIKSLMIFEFLKEYNQLEHLIREKFEQNLPNLPSDILQQLYFYNGGRVATYIDAEEGAVKLNTVKYKRDDLFKEIKVNQLIKILKKNPCMQVFNCGVVSIQRTTTVYSFYDCVIRLLNMRNKLAHEMENLQFKDQDLIELLSLEQIEKETFEILQNFDVKKMDNMTQYIASNTIYMRKLLDLLNVQ
ncbi:hypothetical protein DWZ08_01510 [Clostridiaceae bacterium AF29-16BH]|nr:hypothetical protein DWZ37_01570 [Clostridiaceae bacterium AF31-3BH]RHQ27141.1 hypothetical protein DWZ08_01510 [Clostridiaceae bacterium AF29-16BH]